MPFIVQCPHADCRKFMLLEDETRGTQVDCLLCKKQIRVDPAKPASAPSPASAPAASAQQKVVTCPNPGCQTALRLNGAAAGQSIRCPKCNQVFKI